tara:strand:- start:701 stop:1150 length:450 start_codon:yes stop_codon:yes gene_type:complete
MDEDLKKILFIIIIICIIIITISQWKSFRYTSYQFNKTIISDINYASNEEACDKTYGNWIEEACYIINTDNIAKYNDIINIDDYESKEDNYYYGTIYTFCENSESKCNETVNEIKSSVFSDEIGSICSITNASCKDTRTFLWKYLPFLW